MDIHKPKPWRGLREFLKEYVIIVVGVLTALGAEQAAEALHWRHLAKQHAEDLHNSAQFVALNAIHRLSIDVCLRGELKAVGEALRQPGETWRGLNPRAQGLPADWLPPRLTSPGRAWAYAAWDSAVGDGALTHLPRRSVRSYALLFATSKDILAVQGVASEQMPELAPLAFDQKLTAQDKAHYLTAVAKADRTLSQMDNMAHTILSQAAQEGFWPEQASIAPQLDAARKQMGDCIHDVPRSDFADGGRWANPLMRQWVKAD